MNRIRILIMLAGVAGIMTGCPPLLLPHSGHELRIFLDRPEAKEVKFLSSLNRYKPVSMNRIDSGIWEIRVPEDKEFDYFFSIDGSLYTPNCRLRQMDDWGGRQCIYSPGGQEP